MYRAIFWKELREQGLIGLTLLVLGSGILVAAATLADPPVASANPADVIRYLGAGPLATVLLAVTAGMVCGGALFAAEREAGTLGFLESLPAARRHIWAAKLLAGTSLAVVQIGTVLAVAAALGLVATPGRAVEIGVYAVLAFAWGALGSTLSRTTLGAVGVAIPAAVAATFVVLIPVMVFFHNPGTNLPEPRGVLLYFALMLVTPVALSAAAYTRPDRDRIPAAFPTRTPAHKPSAGGLPPVRDTRRGGFGVKALLWLSVRQLRVPGLILTAFALVFGLSMLLPTIHPFLFWPPVALAAGVLSGVLVFADEQTTGSARYWGERRLPVGRCWQVKVGVHLVFAAWLLVVVALPSVVRAQVVAESDSPRGQVFLSGMFRSLLFDDLGAQGWKYVFLPAAYGFAAGHLCGLLFRKVVVAAGVAVLAGGGLAALWVPSLLAGGVSHWQVWLPPAVLLLTARLLIRAWAADRAAARGPVVTLVGGVAAAVLFLAAGLGYRVVEVTDDPAAEADLRYVEQLPPVGEANVRNAGREFRTAAERFARAADHAFQLDRGPANSLGRSRFEELAETLPRNGWPAEADNVARLRKWLDALADPTAPEDHRWYETATAAAALPVAMYEDPRLIGVNLALQPLENARRMGFVLIARGIHKLTAGDPAAFPADLRTALALAACLQTGSVVPAFRRGEAVEWVAISGVETWLSQLPSGHPGPLRDTLAVLRAFDPQTPFDPMPHLLAERYVIRERQKAPTLWLTERYTPAGASKDATNPEAELVGFAWTVPWERERTRRLIGQGYESGLSAPGRREAYGLIRGRPGADVLRGRAAAPDELAEVNRQLRVLRQSAVLKVAIRLYIEEKKAAPARLDDLVEAKYLPAVPTDPYDGRPFQYRISAGEDINTAQDRRGQRITFGRIAAGQPVVWVAGPSRIGESMFPGQQRAGVVRFAVPLPADDPLR